ncbi:FlgO family outer membrane protein [Desulfohalovibrio reitneri]|uniref:FlgO family outer membrane protein n=1 Tax=Desulfohalovibrio reitneri TaxID=1307759 RepID=UPI00068EF492|nr:FlgO family outer membrane protein [Desulfohalovibrio reitneri]
MRIAFILLTVALLCGGCVKTIEDLQHLNRLNEKKDQCEVSTCVLRANRQAAGELADTLYAREIPPDARILVSTFVDIDSLGTTSTLGRVISEQLMAELAREGLSPVELKERGTKIAMRPGEGEFSLARSASDIIAKSPNGYAVLSGTYSVGLDSVAVSARVVRASDEVVLAGVAYEMPASPQVLALAGIPYRPGPGSGVRPRVATSLSPPGLAATSP